MPKTYTFHELSEDVRKKILEDTASAFVEQHRNELLCELNLMSRQAYNKDGENIQHVL
jgi:hypothetical protein